MTFDMFLAIMGLLLLLCLFAQKYSTMIGIPSLLVFLGIGMLAGQDGLGGIHFENAQMTNYIGTAALAFILFDGGLSTSWSSVKTVLFRGSVLSTLGVTLTALFLYVCAHYFCGLPSDLALLLCVILSSTDAPAVFNSLRSSGMTLKSKKLQALLEFESGSNDPMAVILSVGVIGVLTAKSFSVESSLVNFTQQMGIGILCGYFFGRLFLFVLKHYELAQRGFYPVFGICIVFLVYSSTQMLKGNGYLALYLCGILLGNQKYKNKSLFMDFHDALGWAMQIIMFLTLGLLVNPRELGAVFSTSMDVTSYLIFIARPLAVFICLVGSEYSIKEKLFVSWAGLKGAVPIILATYPLMIDYPQSQFLFNLIFFLVILSVFIQGRSLPSLAKQLGLVDDEIKIEPVNADSDFNTENIASFWNSVIKFLKEIYHEIYGILVEIFKQSKPLIYKGKAIVIRQRKEPAEIQTEQKKPDSKKMF